MTTSKYINEQGSLHPDALQWPGSIDGYPVLGKPQLTTQKEMESIEHAAYYHFELLDVVNSDADRKRYTEIMDRVQNGLFKLVHINRAYTTADGDRVWLEWVQIYGIKTPRRQG